MRPTLKTRKVLPRAFAFLAAVVFTVEASASAEWKLDTVDKSGTGRYASMKIDPEGNVHLAYVSDDRGHPLKYSFWDHAIGRWFTMTIAQDASFCTLALDSNSRPHISYATYGTGKGAKLHYIYLTGGANWKNQTISPLGDSVVAYYTSVALDAKDNPSFSYYDYDGPGDVGFVLRLRCVVWNGSYWEVQMVDRQPGSGKFNSIAIDSSGNPHIAYANVKAEYGSLRYASRSEGTWKTETLEGGSGMSVGIFSVALLIDRSDTPHIAYTDVSSCLVKYATRQNGAWRLEVVGSVKKGAYPDRNGIALDGDGNPYISYYDALAGTLRIAFRKSGRWYNELVARDFEGFTSSLAIQDGMLWVAFADESNGTLKVGRRKLEESTTSEVGHTTESKSNNK